MKFLDFSNRTGQFFGVSNPARQFLDVPNPVGQFLDISLKKKLKKFTKSKKFYCNKINLLLFFSPTHLKHRKNRFQGGSKVEEGRWACMAVPEFGP